MPPDHGTFKKAEKVKKVEGPQGELEIRNSSPRAKIHL